MNSIYNKGVTRLMLALCTVGISLSSCSNDEALGDDSASPKAIQVKVSTRGAVESFWMAEDVITLQASANGQVSQTATYTYDDTNTWSTNSAILWPSTQASLDFMGYFPTTATADGLEFSIPTDQSDAAKLHAADYMTTDCIYGRSYSNASDRTVDFAFNHRLVKVVMNVIFGTEYGTDVPALSLARILSPGSGVTVTANVDNNTTSTVATTGTAMMVQPLISTNADGKPCYTALVTPGELANGSTVLMTFAVDGDMRQATYTGSLTQLESGKVYSFDVKIGCDVITVSEATVTPWNSDAIEGGEAIPTNFKPAYTIKDYFYWDAYTYVTNGDEKTFSEGNWGYNTGSDVATSHSCASCPTASQMVAYLKAGVYWDDSSITEGQMTYSAPKEGTIGSETVTNLHTGLWVKKKSVISDNFDSETETSYSTDDHKDEGVFKNLRNLSDDEVKRIRTGGDYFFLPATGYYSSGSGYFYDAGSIGRYWSSSPDGDGGACYLYFLHNRAGVTGGHRFYGYLPMVAE